MDGARLRAARMVAGLQQAQVAEATGLSRQYYCDIEHGRREAPDDTYARLCAAVGLESDRPAVRLAVVEAALERLARVGGAFSYDMAGPHWEELCGALSEARRALRS